jgi:hypothetical protein
LLAAVDHLLDNGNARSGAQLWNLLQDRGITSGDRWTAASIGLNRRFGAVPLNGGMAWRSEASAGVIVQWTPEMMVRLDGRQAEYVDIARQRLYVPAGARYRLVVESRTEGLKEPSGLEWEIRDAHGVRVAAARVPPSEEWERSGAEVLAAAEDRVMNLVLSCRRLTGSMRAEGVAWFRLTSLEAVE